MSSSARLEQEAEQTRSELARTLDELRERITPGQLVDQAVDYAKDSTGGDFARNLGRQMADNPLPVTLIGAGMAWLMLANGKARGPSHGTGMAGWSSRAGSSLDETQQNLSGMAADTRAAAANAKDKAGQVASDAKDAVSRAAGSTAESAASLYGSAKSSASDAYDRISSASQDATATMAGTASDLGRRSMASTRDFVQFCRTQPLFLGGLGLALGAVIGALIPATETEDQLMGETSDRVKEQARDAAQEQYQKASESIERDVDKADASSSPSPQPAKPGDEASLVPTETDNKVEEWTE